MHRYQNCLYGATRDILMAYVYMPSIQKKRLPLISSFIYQSFHFLYQSFQSYQTAFHIYFSYFQQFSCPFFFCCQTPHLPVSFIFLKKIHYAKIMTKKRRTSLLIFITLLDIRKQSTYQKNGLSLFRVGNTISADRHFICLL